MDNLKGIRTRNFFGMFNHNLFEDSIRKDKARLANYKRMITEIIRFDYINQCPKGTPMLVFFASVDMCTLMAKHLAAMFPDKVVNRYVGEDDYHDLLKADIAVTTLKSAGTALDIPNLSYVLMTVFVSSKQANIQGLGRLRRLKDHPDWTPRFSYLTCRNIDKSMKYMEEKQRKFEGKVLAHGVQQTPWRI
jgi:superfamily II DNA or RNA helicase